MDDFNDFGNKDNEPKHNKSPEKHINRKVETEHNEVANEPIATSIEDDEFVDLSKFYNKDDIGILSDDDMKKEEPEPKEEKTKPKKNVNPWVKKGIAIFLAAVVLAGVLFSIFRDKNTYYALYKQGDKISNGSIELTVEHANVLDSLLTYQMDENYVYVAVVYTFKNISKQTLGWESTPYMSLQPYTLTDKGYLPLSAEEKASLLETLKSLKDNNADNTDNSGNGTSDGTPNDNTQLPDTTAPDSVTVDENGNQAADGSTTDPANGTNSNDGVLIGDAYDEEVKSATEASGDESVTGVFDFNALQIFALDAGLDFSTVKDDLKPGESRQSADVFKIRKELFDNKKYFIGADNLPGIIEISLTPLDIDSKQQQTEQDAQQQHQTTEDGGNQ